MLQETNVKYNGEKAKLAITLRQDQRGGSREKHRWPNVPCVFREQKMHRVFRPGQKHPPTF